MSIFPPLDGFEATRKTLHNYAQALGVIPRTHAQPHPQWWHISLRLWPYGLRTTAMNLPDGGQLWLEMDLQNHMLRVETSLGGTQAVSMRQGLTGTEMGDWVITAVAQHGLTGDYARAKFESDEARDYEAKEAEGFLTAVTQVHRIFTDHRRTLTGRLSPIQLWPHNFDLSLEWFGTRTVTTEEHGKVQEFPAQLNLGFYPGPPIYFYSNPFPFQSDSLLNQELPTGAYWHTKGWQGTMLPYTQLVGDPHAETRLRHFAHRVYEITRPTLIE
ncbi:MAG: hypothetical protein H6658_17275 [Ardenticatenaceae bacterium]|nr:hypothetical protein [Ardenticatenaceae bacterium]